METKLKELTEKLYLDGVKKGEGEAQEIIENARKEADKIIAAATAKAQTIVKTTEAQVSSLKEKTETELRLSAQQSLNELKNKITGLITMQLMDNLSSSLNDRVFFQNLVLKIVESWFKKSGDNFNMEIEIKKEGSDEIVQILREKCSFILQQGLKVKINEDAGIGFSVAPLDRTFVLEFSPESFAAFFKDYLRTATSEMLFN